MSSVFRQIPSSTVSAIAQDIDLKGYAVVEDFVAPDHLSVAQRFVSDAVAASGGDYAGFNGTKDLGGTFLASLPNEPNFNALCHGIYEKALGQPAPDTGYYQILRCLSGPGVNKHSIRFDFDSYILTALIPIMIPDHGAPGRLIIHPNTRPLRRSYLANLADKALVDNPLTQALLTAAYKRGSKRVIRLPLKPGHLYFFWDYRSLHTNEPCDADTIRATALLHYVDPHANSRLKQALTVIAMEVVHPRVRSEAVFPEPATPDPGPRMDAHQSARTTHHSRQLIVARLAQGWTVSTAAVALGITPKTVRKWRDRFAAQGAAGLADRLSCLHTSSTRLDDTAVA